MLERAEFLALSVTEARPPRAFSRAIRRVTGTKCSFHPALHLSEESLPLKVAPLSLWIKKDIDTVHG